MLMVCPECYKILLKRGKDTIGSYLNRVDIFNQFPEAGQCPCCKKIWNEDGKELKVEIEIKDFNPSERNK